MRSMKYFSPKAKLVDLIDNYFNKQTGGTDSVKITDPPTIAGLVLHLGFDDKDDFDRYENNGRFGYLLKHARYRVMAYYESRLYYPSATGAMFALKSMGWFEKAKLTGQHGAETSIEVKLIETGPNPAATEGDVAI